MSASFDDAARALFDASVSAGREYDQEPFLIIQRCLLRMVGARFYTLTATDAQDVVSEATIKFIRAARLGRIERQGAPAYLTTITIHEASNERRRTKTSPLGEATEHRVEEDAIAGLDRRMASTQIVSRALDQMAMDGEGSCAEIIRTWLEQSRIGGTNPTNRSVAKAADVTHPTVARCLRIFTSRLSAIEDVAD